MFRFSSRASVPLATAIYRWPLKWKTHSILISIRNDLNSPFNAKHSLRSVGTRIFLIRCEENKLDLRQWQCHLYAILSYIYLSHVYTLRKGIKNRCFISDAIVLPRDLWLKTDLIYSMYSTLMIFFDCSTDLRDIFSHSSFLCRTFSVAFVDLDVFMAAKILKAVSSFTRHSIDTRPRRRLLFRRQI